MVVLSYFEKLGLLLAILSISLAAYAAPLQGTSNDLHFISKISPKRAVHCYLPEGATRGKILVGP